MLLWHPSRKTCREPSIPSATGSVLLFLTLTICCTTDSSESFNLSSIASLQNLTSAVTLRLYGCTAVRLYGYGGTSGAGTYRLDSPSAGTGLVLGGTLIAPTGGGGGVAPEPGSLALLAFATVPLAGIVVRRRRTKR